MTRFLKYFLPFCILFILLLTALLLSEKHYYISEGDTLPSAGIRDEVFSYELINNKKQETTEISKLHNYIFDTTGEYKVSSRLFGVIPVADASVSVYRERELLLGGQSVGLILNTDGVVVVGFSAVENQQGKMIYPAKEAGIKLGDCIVAIEGNAVNSDNDVLNLINRCGEDGSVELTLHCAGKTLEKTVKSFFCEETGRYRIGLYVRDNTGGIGTMTFYDPLTKRFGALGHTVTEAKETQNGVSGRLLSASVSNINPAAAGKTGEKIGYFEANGIDGVIDRIGSFGVFGEMEEMPEKYCNSPVQTASPNEIKEGPAQIITVLKGDRTETYDIEITNINANDKSGKGLAITVTDKTLLAEAGGIIQGMSGSPILQNGKLVGAVTYVMVNQPQKGYGCFIHDMLKECGIE